MPGFAAWGEFVFTKPCKPLVYSFIREVRVVKLQKSAGARNFCPKIQRVLGTLGINANSSPAIMFDKKKPPQDFIRRTLVIRDSFQEKDQHRAALCAARLISTLCT